VIAVYAAGGGGEYPEDWLRVDGERVARFEGCCCWMGDMERLMIYVSEGDILAKKVEN
jgi:hypothetical protein